jgi:hypothetical protein
LLILAVGAFWIVIARTVWLVVRIGQSAADERESQFEPEPCQICDNSQQLMFRLTFAEAGQSKRARKSYLSR